MVLTASNVADDGSGCQQPALAATVPDTKKKTPGYDSEGLL